MPVGFTNEHIDIIKNKLLINGRLLFIKYGYKQVGVREITKEVGISSGMFYKMYQSKDDLFFLILQIEQEQIRLKIVDKMMAYKDDPVTALNNFYYIIIEELKINPLMKTILLKKEYDTINSKITKEEKLDEKQKSINHLMELVTYWKENHLIREIDINLVLQSLRALVLLWFHQDDIGEDHFSLVMEFLIDRVCEYVTTKE